MESIGFVSPMDGRSEAMRLNIVERLNVLFVGSPTEIGGAEVAMLTMLEHAPRDKVQCSYVTLQFGSGELPTRVQSLGVKVLFLQPGRLRNFPNTVARIWKLTKFIRNEKADIVVCNGGHPLVVARPAAALCARPMVWWVHGYDPSEKRRGGLLAAAQRWLGADFLIANSEYTASRLRQDFPSRPAIRAVPYGIDTNRICPSYEKRIHMRNLLGIGEGTVVVGLFGRLEANKGQHVAVEAMQKLIARGVKVRLLIVGSTQFHLDAGYGPMLREQVKAMGMHEHIEFLGQRSDIAEVLSACDIALQPAIVPEAFGLTITEAMAAGIPVIAAKHGGAVEQIEEGLTGFFHKPGDVDDLAASIERLVKDCSLRSEIGRNARNFVVSQFEAGTAARRFFDVVAEMHRECGGN